MATWYVNMHDKFLSGCGHAANARSILCIKCDTYEQAEAIEAAAMRRPEMRRVAIADKPRRGRPGDRVDIRPFAKMHGPWLQFWRGPVDA